jgi:tetratricopeptide (TPR) repeat protein
MEKGRKRLKGRPVAEAWLQARHEGLEGESAWNRALLLVALRCCPVCREEVKSIHDWQLAGGVGEPPPKPGELGPPTAEERARAEKAIAPLAGLARKARLAAVRRSRSTLRGRAVVEALLAAARAALPGAPEDSKRWAECALWAARDTAGQNAAEDRALAAQEARAWGYVANVERIRADFPAAERAFDVASLLLEMAHVTELRPFAELRNLYASFCRARREFDAAVEMLEGAALLYDRLGDGAESLRALVKLTSVLNTAQRWAESSAVVERLDTALGPDLDASLHLGNFQNGVVALLELGETRGAKARFLAGQAIYLEFPDAYTQGRRHYLLGRLAQAEGLRPEAEAAFRESQRILLDAGDAFSAAVAALDLAILYLDEGRWPEVRELTAAMLAVFASLGIHREAHAAWRLFLAAVERQEANIDAARRLSRFLEHARHDPALVYSTAE